LGSVAAINVHDFQFCKRFMTIRTSLLFSLINMKNTGFIPWSIMFLLLLLQKKKSESILHFEKEFRVLIVS